MKKMIALAVVSALLLSNAVAAKLSKSGHSYSDVTSELPEYFQKAAGKAFGDRADFVYSMEFLKESFVDKYEEVKRKLSHVATPVILVRISPTQNKRALRVYYPDVTEEYYPIKQRKLADVAHLPADVLLRLTPFLYNNNSSTQHQVIKDTHDLLDRCELIQQQLQHLPKGVLPKKSKQLIVQEMDATVHLLRRVRAKDFAPRQELDAYMAKVRPILTYFLQDSIRDLNEIVEASVKKISMKLKPGAIVYIVHAVGVATPGINTISKRIENKLHEYGFKTYTINTVEHGQSDAELRDTVVGDIMAENYLKSSIFMGSFGSKSNKEGGISSLQDKLTHQNN